MKINKILVLYITLIAISSCKNKARQTSSIRNEQTQTTTLQKKDLDEIKKYLEYQKRINTEEQGFENPHTITKMDLELVSKVIFEGLKNNGYKDITDQEFIEKIKFIFNIENLKSPFYKIHAQDNVITLFGQQNEDYKELIKNEFYLYLYTDNFYLMKNQHLITEFQTLKNLIKVNPDNTYRITIEPYIIHRNKYLFNDDKVSLSWLLNNDQVFLTRLLTNFSYDKEPKINKMVLDSIYKQNTQGGPVRGQVIADLFFIKDRNNKLQIREGLLKYAEDNTSSADNRFIYALGGFADILYYGDGNRIFNEDPSKKFTPLEKAKIVAYIANIENPAINKYKNVESSHLSNNAASTLYNLSVSHPEIIKLIEENNYFGLPKLKGIIERLEEQAPPAPGDSE